MTPSAVVLRRPMILALMLLLASPPADATIIDNDVPEGVLGHWSVDVASGGETTSATITAERLTAKDLRTTNVVFLYASYVDVGKPGAAMRLAGTAPVVDPADPDRVSSTGSFTGANGNPILWEVSTSVADGSPLAVNVIRFTAQDGALGDLRFLQYLDEDVDGADDDVFLARGSVAGRDLQLFTLDSQEVFGVSHSGALSAGAGPAGGLVNARFAGWAADVFDMITERLLGAGQAVSLDGVIMTLTPTMHPVLGQVYGPADIVSVLAWDVDPTAASATIITTLGGVAAASAIGCGDGIVDTAAGEACDLRDANGLPGSCCTAQCRLRPAGERCRAAASACDVEEVCDGTTATCPADAFAADGDTCDDGDPGTGTSSCLNDVCTGVATTITVPPEIMFPPTARRIKIPVQVAIPDGGTERASVRLDAVVDCLDLPDEQRPKRCGMLGTASTLASQARIESVLLRVTPRRVRNLGRTRARSTSLKLPLTKLGKRLFAKLRAGETSRSLPLRLNAQLRDRQGRSITARFPVLLSRRR
jgi:hypothetical protein